MTNRQTTFQTYREAADAAHPVSASMESRTELWNRAEYAEFVLERTKKRLARVERSRNWGWSLFVIALVFALMLLARVAIASDPLNEDLQTAAGDSLKIAKFQGGSANVRYISLYGVAEAQRTTYAAGISIICHHLSHAGVAVHPAHVTDTVLRLDLDALDPFNKGWAKGWEKIVRHDRRWHSGHVTPQGYGGGIYRGSTVEILCKDNRYYPAEVLDTFDGGFRFSLSGKTYSTGAKWQAGHNYRSIETVKEGLAYGEWVDLASAKLLEEITHSRGAILDARDFAYHTLRHAAIYYEFRATPPTLKEWQERWGDTQSPSGFGLFGIRGANLDVSNVTHTVRGLERGRLGAWVTFDLSKNFELTDDRDVFAYPDRTSKWDATEALAITEAGALDCAIFDGNGKRVDAVPPAVAIDDSHGFSRELTPPLSCISCHCKKVGGEETSGFLSFTDRQSQAKAFTKDPQLAATLAAYYADQRKLTTDMARDREDIRRGFYAATETGIDDKLEPSEGVAILNQMVDDVTVRFVDAELACRELGIEAEDELPAVVLSRYLNGTVNRTLVDLMNGQTVHPSRFYQSMPEALFRISAKKQFAGAP